MLSIDFEQNVSVFHWIGHVDLLITGVFPAILIKVLERAFCQEHNNLVLAYQILHVMKYLASSDSKI